MKIRKPTTWKGFGVYTAILFGSVLVVVLIVNLVVLPMVVGSTATLDIPNVEGRTLEDAIIILEGRGLEVMEPHEQYSSDVKAGIVVNQMPYPGATVKEGRRVYLTVSKGVETATMPDLRGRSVREARLTLLRLGMQLGGIEYESNDSVPAETIVYQSIPAGQKVTSDLVPSIVVSSGPDAIIVPSLIGLKSQDAIALVQQSGLTCTIQRRQKSNTFDPDVVLYQNPEADSLAPPGSTVMITVTE